eukprot:scaffold111874_cov14-Tisochrysis_lutea.AAC.1
MKEASLQVQGPSAQATRTIAKAAASLGQPQPASRHQKVMLQSTSGCRHNAKAKNLPCPGG